LFLDIHTFISKVLCVALGIFHGLKERDPEHPGQKITCSLFLPTQGRLVCGMNDGQIIIVSATQTIMLHLLAGKHQGVDGEYLALAALAFQRQSKLLSDNSQIDNGPSEN
jgi:hypothetical protein